MEWYTAVSLAAAIVVMVSASYFDWRYREVPDLHWWVLGISGLVLTAASFGDIGTEVLMMLIGSALLLLLILLDLNVPAVAELIVFLIMVALFAYPAVTAFDDPNVKRMLVIPVCCLIFYLMFSFGILKGGADAKCLMTMAMMFQTCPEFLGLPLIPLPQFDIQLIFSFPIAVLFHAALFSFAWLFWTVIRKIYRKEDPVQMVTLSCYRMSIDDARRSHVWSKQDVVNGMIVNVRGVADEGAYDRLEAAGAKDVWVTPIIPFMVPITIAVIFILTIGSLLNIPFSL